MTGAQIEIRSTLVIILVIVGMMGYLVWKLSTIFGVL